MVKVPNTLPLGQRTFIRPGEIQSIFGVSRSSAYSWMARGEFPELVKIGPRCRGWRKSDLDAHFGIEEMS
jgi:predicted DNA-binding transcriptional regulator AlpA